jgi:hypothetical protein
MALILEVGGARGVTARLRLERLPITIGRALTNDLILDDAWVDATHARIVMDDAGAVRIEDAGSLNGIMCRGVRIDGSLALAAGMDLELGRTTLHIRDAAESVAPALRLTGRTTAIGSNAELIRRWAPIVAVYAVIGVNTWLGDTGRSGVSTAGSMMLGSMLLMMPWTFVWALSTRGPERQMRFSRHLSALCSVVLVLILGNVVTEWLTFLSPREWATALFGLLVMGALGWIVAAHLAVATIGTRQKRLKTGIVVAATIFVIGLAASQLDTEEFSDVAKFPSELKPVPVRLVPTVSVQEFITEIADAKTKADEALSKEP